MTTEIAVMYGSEKVNETLRSLQAGIPAYNSLALDLKYAKVDGIQKVQDFMAERV